MHLLFFILLAAGLLMISLEIFLPGGIIGTLGGLALIGAIIIGFSEFGTVTGTYILAAIVVLLCVCIMVWIKYFPKTIIGRSMTLSTDGKDFKSSDERFLELVGKEGETLTELRPAGLIRLDGAKYDVVSEGSLVEKGKRVQVVKAGGRRIVVREIEEA